MAGPPCNHGFGSSRSSLAGEIFLRREGEGPEILLVHGGARPRRTWGTLEPLAARWTLLLVYRRGYPPSPPGPHDFDIDAADIAPLLDSRPHVVAHSYGVLGTLLAAAARPEYVRSLTLIEPPLYHLVPNDPDVAHFKRIGDAFLTEGLEGDPDMLREFLVLAGAEGVDDGPLPERLARFIDRARGGRLPGEARPSLHVLREAQIPSLVASGGHTTAVERICDALAGELDAERIILPGAGHFVAAAPGFSQRLERHLLAA